MPIAGIKQVASSQNGVGAFILQCTRLDVHYCDVWASSRGMNSFLLSKHLRALTAQFPQTEFRISPRPNHHPVIRAHYVNGREKAVCVRNLDPNQIRDKMELLLGNSGLKNRRVRGKWVVSENEGVRGIWSALHGGIKDV